MEPLTNRSTDSLLLAFLCLFVVKIVHPALTPTQNKDIPCLATVTPANLLVKQHDNESMQMIRCSAIIKDAVKFKDTFSRPLFDVSFGLTPSTGIFLVRGEAKCDSDYNHCWSDITINANALQHLILPPNLNREQNLQSSKIDLTCNVADSSNRTNAEIRCSDSSIIHFSKVLNFGDRCFEQNADEECGANMKCTKDELNDFRCNCVEGLLPYGLSKHEVICVPKVSIGEKCNFTKQCTETNVDSLCELETTLGFRVCKCLSGFEEVLDTQNQLFCSKITFTTLQTYPTFELKEEISVTPNINAEQMKSHDNLESHKPAIANNAMISKSSQLGLIVFSAVLLVAIVIVAFIIRTRKCGRENSFRNDNYESNHIAQNKNNGSFNGKLLKGNNCSEEEEVEISIDEGLNQAKLIEYDASEFGPNIDKCANEMQNPSANFNFSAKQSVV